jgi:hypothetical protein
VSEVTPRSRSLFQVSVVVGIIVLLAAVLLNALNYVQEKAERTVMEATVLNMEKGLQIEVQTREIRRQAGSFRDPVGANPVTWLASPPEGYSGVCKTTRAPGEWCFDQTAHEIVYRPRLDKNLEFRVAGARELRWRVGLSKDSVVPQAGGNEPGGEVRLISTTSFVWH